MTNRHRLVTLGDSLTQGFMSGAIHSTHLSYPAIIAHEMGLSSGQFRFPSFATFGGLPLNLERILRFLEREYGAELGPLEHFGAAFRLRELMAEIETYYERGTGRLPTRVTTPYHNLASWGMTVDDLTNLTAGHCISALDVPTSDDFVNQVPEQSFFLTVLRVLNSSHSLDRFHHTAVTGVREFANDGGIENLIVAIGANNALGSATALKIKMTDDAILSAPVDNRGNYNLWRTEHFQFFYDRLVEQIASIDIDRVFVATVPHITIAPLIRGVGTSRDDRLSSDPRYFKFYTYFWIEDDDFSSRRHPHLTGDQAKLIDQTIDTYNAIIRDHVESQRAAGRSWHLVDLTTTLDRLAFRRHREFPGLPPAPGGPYDFPDSWESARRRFNLPELDTRYLVTAGGQLTAGGLFSLDGIHPSTMGYGLLAHEMIQVMRVAGVEFRTPTGELRADPVEVDFERLARFDTLVRTPPKLLDDAVGILNWLDGWIGLSGILRKVNGC